MLNTGGSVYSFNYLRKMVIGELNDLTCLQGIFGHLLLELILCIVLFSQFIINIHNFLILLMAMNFYLPHSLA